jgi:uncharacterized damage-inducible protein DinB
LDITDESWISGWVSFGPDRSRRGCDMPELLAAGPEKAVLLGFLRQQRSAVHHAVYGLNDEQARAVPTASRLSLGGLVKHLARTERGWLDLLQQQGAGDGPQQYLAGFVMAPHETLAQLAQQYRDVAAHTEAVLASIDDLGAAVPLPPGLPWLPAGTTHLSARWVLLHLIEETARHGGHADVIRESLDGATAPELRRAVESITGSTGS